MHLAQSTLNVLEQKAAFAGDANLARAALEQDELDGFFELANGVADRTGGDAEFLGGQGKGFGSAGSLEDLEGGQGHTPEQADT